MPNPVTAVAAAGPPPLSTTSPTAWPSRPTSPTSPPRSRPAATPASSCIDARSPRSYEAGHLPGARLLPRPFAAEDVAALGDALLVVYCWGPACNGATKAARELAALGRPVKEMIGGFEYWERDGHPVERGVPALAA